MDTISQESLVGSDLVKHTGKKNNKRETKWETQAGNFKTKKYVQVKYNILPQFTYKSNIVEDFQVLKSRKTLGYVIIIGKYMQQEITLYILNITQAFEWAYLQVYLVEKGHRNREMIKDVQWNKTFNYGIEQGNEESLMQFQIKDLKCDKPNLTEIPNNQNNL